MAAHVQSVRDIGGDRIQVTGTVDGLTTDDGEALTVQAIGWVSAMENHYPDDTRDDEGHRDPNAQARPMTDEERMAYWQGLLAEAVPQPRPEPTTLYEAPEE